MWVIGKITEVYVNVIAPFFSKARYHNGEWLEQETGREDLVSHTRYKWDSGDSAVYEGPLEEHPTFAGRGGFCADHVFSRRIDKDNKLLFAISEKQAQTYLRTAENSRKRGSPYLDNRNSVE